MPRSMSISPSDQNSGIAGAAGSDETYAAGAAPPRPARSATSSSASCSHGSRLETFAPIGDLAAAAGLSQWASGTDRMASPAGMSRAATSSGASVAMLTLVASLSVAILLASAHAISDCRESAALTARVLVARCLCTTFSGWDGLRHPAWSALGRVVRVPASCFIFVTRWLRARALQ